MVKTNPLSLVKIEEYAYNLRKQCKLSLSDAFPIYDYINYLCDLGLLNIQILDNNDKYLNDNCVAKYNSIDNFIYIRESILDDYECNNYRANFTLAHELFHYIQSKILNFDFEEVDECKAYEDLEWQANNFAGELLLPKSFLDVDDNKLIDMFKVTMECVLTRKVLLKKRNKYNKE